ncbi:uncharacterized protein [Macrobrachium rosenbergii]|uniref:uncharacterized protein n=1 Tax=Macrobrachium rosenbergii TaxID=79674 RepID=UPI0034D70AA3
MPCRKRVVFITYVIISIVFLLNLYYKQNKASPRVRYQPYLKSPVTNFENKKSETVSTLLENISGMAPTNVNKISKMKTQRFFDIVKRNSHIMNYLERLEEVYDDLFYKIYPVSVGVPETPTETAKAIETENETVNIDHDSSTGVKEEDGGLSVTSYSLPGCNCSRKLGRNKQDKKYVVLRRYSAEHHMAMSRTVQMISSCSDHATARGPKQKVVSYSYFGNTSDVGLYNRYFSEMRNRALEIHRHYPGFVMRVYHNVGPEDEKGQREICQAFCDIPLLDFCDVSALPSPWFDFGDQQKVGTLWRFLTLLDPLVDATLFRDLDSYVLPREAAAVEEWLRSNSSYHVMRDHPLHNGQILAGLWGSQTHLDRANAYHYGALMLSQPYHDLWDYDQRLLRRILWPQIRNRTMVHDSYTCRAKLFQGQGPARPFPTRREGRNYTGYGKTKSGVTKLLKTCPVACRPKSHKDWLLC